MWAAAAVVLCLALSKVGATWGSGDSSLGNLGLYTEFMECDANNERCVHCFQEKSGGNVYMHTFEFTLNPVKFQINIFAGTVDRKIYVIRDDPDNVFRSCFEHDWTPSKTDDYKVTICLDNNFEGVFRSCFERDWTPSKTDDYKVNICMDNNFEGVTVPEECGSPVAVVSFDYHHTDDKIHGQQVLYCLPNTRARDGVQ